VVVLAVDTGATLLGVAAIISAMGGIVSTMFALRKSHDEEYAACLERLKTTRAEAEQYAAELHEHKIHRGPRGHAG
jgi:adenine/guanine phosphoribosyltransferase-like PRPP-binding protein